MEAEFQRPLLQIVKDLNQRLADKEFQLLPRDEECLSYLVRFHLKVAGKDFHQHLKQVHLRPFVLVMLLAELVDNCHPAVASSVSGAVLKERYAKAVEARYPETEQEKPLEERQGRVPLSILKLLQAQQESDAQFSNVTTTLNNKKKR